MPTVEDLVHDINGSIVFSKLDLKWGFHQVMLDEVSRDITTFVTHRGLFRYKRLMFSLCSAPEKYNKIIRDVLKNCQGCANIADDVIVHGKTLAEHDKNLIAVLDTLRESGLTVNEKKCKFRLPKLTFFGHGIEPSEEKIAAIQDCESPKTGNEARSFMGLVQYSSKFIPDLASIARPIQNLTRKYVDFVWGKKQQCASDILKSLRTTPDVLAYFRNDCQTQVVTDASPTGLGAVLTQCQNGILHVIAYASRVCLMLNADTVKPRKKYLPLCGQSKGLMFTCLECNLS